MGDYDHLELQGEERDRVLQAIRAQVAAWGLSMPEAPPIPLHFGLNRFSEIGETEFWIANEQEHGYCGKFLFLFDGQTCPYHRHRQKHETFYVVNGSIRMRVGESDRLLQQGDVLAMPPGAGHSFTGLGPALVLEVSMPTLLHDNFFADNQIGNDGVI